MEIWKENIERYTDQQKNRVPDYQGCVSEAEWMAGWNDLINTLYSNAYRTDIFWKTISIIVADINQLPFGHPKRLFLEVLVAEFGNLYKPVGFGLDYVDEEQRRYLLHLIKISPELRGCQTN